MHNTKPKVGICPKCGSGMAPRWRGNQCIDCTNEEEKQKAMKLQVKKINIKQKPQASPSKARTKDRKPKANRSGGRRTKSGGVTR